jgi:hypothetical protein
MKKMSKLVTGTLAVALLTGLAATGCGQDTSDDRCLNKTTFVGNGARNIVQVPAPFAPGAIGVISVDEVQGTRSLSTSSRLYLGDDGLSLYALDGSTLRSVDLSTLESSSVKRVGDRTQRLIGLPNDTAVLVTDSGSGSVYILDTEEPDGSVRVPVGEGAGALALAPGNRIAYVANESSRSVSLVETGLGWNPETERTVVIASRTEGQIALLDQDARVLEHWEGLPLGIRELALLPDGETLVGTFSTLTTTGEPGVIGDGTVQLAEGWFFLHLGTGQVTVHALPVAEPAHAATLARPTGMAIRADRYLAIALPGWSTLAIVDLAVDRGLVAGWLPVPGRPQWIVSGTLAGDQLYVLDSDAGRVHVLDDQGKIPASIDLR